MELSAVLTVIALVVFFAAIAFAIVQIARNEALNTGEKAIWVAVVVFFPVIGAVIWFLAGPHPFGLRVPRSDENKRR